MNWARSSRCMTCSSPAPSIDARTVPRGGRSLMPKKEDAGAEAVRAGAQVEIPVHLKRGDRQVRAIDPRPEVQRDEKRKQPEVHASQRASADRRLVSGRHDTVVHTLTTPAN